MVTPCIPNIPCLSPSLYRRSKSTPRDVESKQGMDHKMQAFKVAVEGTKDDV
jgi:hypothetical protein